MKNPYKVADFAVGYLFVVLLPKVYCFSLKLKMNCFSPNTGLFFFKKKKIGTYKEKRLERHKKVSHFQGLFNNYTLKVVRFAYGKKRKMVTTCLKN